MEPIDNERATAQELVSYAHRRGVDLEGFREDSLFQNGQRWIFLWRKQGAFQWAGSASERDGILHYHMQGAISALPCVLKGANGAFQGAWYEAGTFEDLDQAFGLVKAWLLDWKEVDDLPSRLVNRCGI